MPTIAHTDTNALNTTSHRIRAFAINILTWLTIDNHQPTYETILAEIKVRKRTPHGITRERLAYLTLQTNRILTRQTAS